MKRYKVRNLKYYSLLTMKTVDITILYEWLEIIKKKHSYVAHLREACIEMGYTKRVSS